MTSLTEKQRDVLDFIVQRQRQGQTPTLSEISKGCKLAGVSTAQMYVLTLERKGYLKVTPNLSRSIKVLDTGKAETIWGDFAV